MISIFSQCDEIINLDEKCVKAYFRRGQALLGTHDPDSALKDFEKVNSWIIFNSIYRNANN